MHCSVPCFFYLPVSPKSKNSCSLFTNLAESGNHYYSPRLENQLPNFFSNLYLLLLSEIEILFSILRISPILKSIFIHRDLKTICQTFLAIFIFVIVRNWKLHFRYLRISPILKSIIIHRGLKTNCQTFLVIFIFVIVRNWKLHFRYYEFHQFWNPLLFTEAWKQFAKLF